MPDLRKQFFENMAILARKDKDIMVLVGDLGYSFMEDFQKEFPDQFINCGIAEQNMIGVAAGLARAGKKPYVYSGAIFSALRPYEFIRDDVAYQNLNVKIIGTSASGFLGFTHNLGETESEIEIIKQLPNIKAVEAEDYTLMPWLKVDGPVYLRI